MTAAVIRIEEASNSTPGYIGEVEIILTLETKNDAWIERTTKVNGENYKNICKARLFRLNFYAKI